MTLSMTNHRFPTLGQTIRYAFDVCGVLPRKRGEPDGLSEDDKKRMQKRLERLANEEGRLTENCGAAIEELGSIISATLASPKLALWLGEVSMDLFDVYNAVIRTEGTYLTERDTVRWFCRTHAVPRLVLSVRKHLLRFNVMSEGLLTPPEADWYLPTVTDEKTTWPLEKAMHWAYAVCDTNQTNFHYPGKNTRSARPECPEQTQNLENAGSWRTGRRTPSWNSLHWNFSRSFVRLASVPDAKHRREIPEKLRTNILHVLFVARLSTDICRSISDTYGPAFLSQLVSQYQQHDAWLAPEIARLQEGLQGHLTTLAGRTGDTNRLWWELSEPYWKWFADRLLACAYEMQPLLAHGDRTPPTEETIASLITKYGEYPVRRILDASEMGRDFPAPPAFAKAVSAGFELKSKPHCSDDAIDAYEADLQRSALDACLPWMVPWLRAVVRYRREDFQSAFLHAEQAFEQAKYSAGGKQYELVNLYIELAAKMDRWQSFKKGVEWANFLGISVRWLRDDEPTEDRLRGVFELMKLARYPST